jgi:hypothetical protein
VPKRRPAHVPPPARSPRRNGSRRTPGICGPDPCDTRCRRVPDPPGQGLEELTRPDKDLEELDALTVEPGQRLDGEWTVAKVLGTGSTARALRRVGRDPRIVKLFDGPFTLGEHTVISLEQAGQGSLAQRLRTEGPCTIHELERCGDDLFVALDHLAGEKVCKAQLAGCSRAETRGGPDVAPCEPPHDRHRRPTAGTFGQLKERSVSPLG